MRIVLNIIFIVCGCFLIGCGQSQHVSVSSLQGVKFTDIEPAYDQEHKFDKTIAKIVVYKIRVAADDYSQIQESIWDEFFKDNMTFNNKRSFDNNGFKAGFGKPATWEKIKIIIQGVNSRKNQTVALAIEDNSFDDVYVKSSVEPIELFYSDRMGNYTGHQLDPGRAIFRLFVKKVPQTRSFINVKVMPAYISSVKLSKDSSVKFGLVSFEADLEQGQFILIGPDGFKAGNNTLKGLYFSHSQREDYVNLYLIACLKITD